MLFMYYIRCVECSTVFKVGDHVPVFELSNAELAEVEKSGVNVKPSEDISSA